MKERVVIPVKTGIQIFVILSDPSSVAVALLLRRVEAKDLAIGNENYVAAKR